ncbi:MAG TPA: glutamate mutase L, partial [Bacillota bacterium]|nr:glutamate mutase L [Bacillota bacterium]
VHSVAHAKKEIEKMLIGPEPFAKRTVEGDLGVYINKDNIIDMIGKDKLLSELDMDPHTYDESIKSYQPIPPDTQVPLTERLALEALNIAMERHCGRLVHMYTASGKTTYAEGKDLTNVGYLIGTGGALTRLPGKMEIIKKSLHKDNGLLLKPKRDTKILIDNDYIMASCGVLSKKHPEAAIRLLKQSLEIG